MQTLAPNNGTKPIGRALCFLLVVIFFLSYFVNIEPAPFDVMIVTTLVLLLLSGRIAFHPAIRFEALLIFAYVMVSLTNILRADDEEGSILFFSITTYLIFITLGLSGLIGRYGINILSYMIKGMTAAAIITTTAVLMALMGVSLPGPPLLDSGRGMGWFKDPNVLGPTLILSIAYIFARLGEVRQKDTKFIMKGIFFFLLMGIIATYSRAALVATIITLGLYFFFSNIMHLNVPSAIKVARTVKFALFVITTLTISVLVLHLSGLDKLFLIRAQMQGYDDERFYLHEIVKEQIIEHPFGIGAGRSATAVKQYLGLAWHRAPHQVYLRVTYEDGIIGGFFYAVFLIRLIFVGVMMSIRAWPHYHIAAAMTSVLIGYAVCGFVVDTLHWRCYWIAAGIVLGIKVLYRKHLEELNHLHQQEKVRRLHARAQQA